MTEKPTANALLWLAIEAGLRLEGDPLSALGLGPDTPPRVRVLVAKGLFYERLQEWEMRTQAAKRRRGRPKVKVGKDVLRAVFCVKWALDRLEPGDTDLKIIRKAMNFEAEMERLGRLRRENRLFLGSEEATLQKSVSSGFAKLEKADFAQVPEAAEILRRNLSEVLEKAG